MEDTKPDSLDRALPFLIFAVTGIVFLPAVNWLLQQTVAHEQLLHAFLVFLLSGALLVYERRITIRPVYQFSNTSQTLLIFSYAALVAAIFSKINLIVLVALCLSLTSLLLFVFGTQRRRLIFSSIAAFGLFSGIAVLLPIMDWPLRTLAGKWAAYGLSLFGQQVELGLVRSEAGPMLILMNNGRPFNVAAECNGFGMISSCILMAMLLALYRKLPLFDRLGWIGVAFALGVAFNTIRIILIVLLAPTLPDTSYMMMHEIVGLSTTYGGLAILYFLLMPREANPT
jgi:exosortase/archaeosortase family protein